MPGCDGGSNHEDWSCTDDTPLRHHQDFRYRCPPGGRVLLSFVSNLAGALLALELARFESGQRFRDGKNYLFTSPWAPPHAHMRRYRGRMTDCEFCAQPTAEAAWATVWPAWAQRGEGARKARSSQLCDGVDSKTLDDLRGQ
jgi:hypothetical protein